MVKCLSGPRQICDRACGEWPEDEVWDAYILSAVDSGGSLIWAGRPQDEFRDASCMRCPHMQLASKGYEVVICMYSISIPADSIEGVRHAQKYLDPTFQEPDPDHANRQLPQAGLDAMATATWQREGWTVPQKNQLL